MGFKDLDGADVAAVPGYSEFMNTPLTADGFALEASRCKVLLQTFRKNM